MLSVFTALASENTFGGGYTGLITRSGFLTINRADFADIFQGALFATITGTNPAISTAQIGAPNADGQRRTQSISAARKDRIGEPLDCGGGDAVTRPDFAGASQSTGYLVLASRPAQHDVARA